MIVPVLFLSLSCSAPSVTPEAAPDASSNVTTAPRPDALPDAEPRRAPPAKRASTPVPAEAIEAAGVRGGLVVFIGGSAKPAAKLGAMGSYLMHVIDTDRTRVGKARELIRAEGLYGKLSADVFDGARLPYVDNLVNLVVDQRPEAAGPGAEAFAREVSRVLAPRGVYLAPKAFPFRTPDFRSESTRDWVVYRKPVPDSIDEWTHFLHGPGNNAVARDSVVGPPRHMQWVGSPRYSRHHDKMSSVTAAVSAGGRVFYIEDRAPPFSVLTAPEWRLVARDAFNGTILWTRKIEKWFNDLHPHKSGPAHLPRKLVAEGERVYVTLAIDGSALALDAATGETVRTFEGSEPADELVHSAGALFVRQEGGLVAFDSASGERLWKTDVVPVRGSLAVDARHAVFLVEDRIVCLDVKNGRERWRSDPVPRPKSYHIRFNPILILYEDVVLFAGGEKSVGHRDHQGNYSWKVGIDDTVTALAAETGKLLWTAPHPLSGYASSEDLFVIDGVVWCGETTSGHAVGHFAGRDVRTGKVVREFDPDVKTYWFHHRCHRGKATERYILTSRTGTEFIDPKTGHWQINHWVRGACLYGLMPANGLLYSPQNPCACFLENRMVGFNALAHSRTPVPETATADRLERGPAYSKADARPGSTTLAAGPWPTYRGDTSRSGSTGTAVPARLKPAWTTEVGGRLSSVTVAGGRVFVASIDRHEVLALDEADGRILWRHTAGARVDSPPTIHLPAGQTEALCIFGSRDGTITCLRASGGELVWRFRAAPVDRRVMAYEQIESVWPVSGSVLIHDNVLHAVAGRSLFLDGGLRLVRLDPVTGKLLSETLMDRNDDSGEDIHKYARQHNMPVSLPDILSTDGRHVFMRSQAFKLDGTRLPLKALKYGGNPERYSIQPTQNPEFAHLFSPTGFLDDTWWHRTYWVYGSRFIGGWAGYPQAGKVAPAGRILVFDDERVYGYGRLPKYYRWTKPIEHHLFAARKTGFRIGGKNAHHWTRDVAMFPRGMVKAGELLFIAGPVDSVDEQKAFRARHAPQWREKIRVQAEAFAGRKGGALRAVRAATGEQVSELAMESIPVFDGMAAAGGRLYVSLVDGRVTCLEGDAAR
jgi:outer membrane protein assembly factor BamB